MNILSCVQVTETIHLIVTCGKAAANVGLLVSVEEKNQLFHQIMDGRNLWCKMKPYLRHNYDEEERAIEEAKQIFGQITEKAKRIEKSGLL